MCMRGCSVFFFLWSNTVLGTNNDVDRRTLTRVWDRIIYHDSDDDITPPPNLHVRSQRTR